MNKKKDHVTLLALQGQVEIEGDVIHYKPSLIPEGPNKGQVNICILGSDKEFQRGHIDFEVNFTGSDSRFQVILNHNAEPQVFVGFGIGYNAYGMSLFRAGSNWDTIASAGLGQAPPTGKWLKTSIVVQGSTVSMVLDGVKVFSGQAVISKTQPAFFLHGNDEFKVRHVSIHEQKPNAFVVMQFTDEYDSLYKEVIKPTCERYGYEPVRADDMYSNGLIINDITKSIEEASVIIADISSMNPNVFYEVGYAHASRKPTILMCNRESEKLPFDVSAFRTIFYENTIGGKSQVEERLARHLQNIGG